MIKLENINKYYNKKKSNEIHVLKNLSVTFEDKGLVTILGPSGSGKSTLLHVIGGLDEAKGQISYDDITFNKFCNNKMDIYRNEKIGYIFQNYHLLNDLTVYQNLKLQLELIGITNEKEVEERISICLKAIGMEKYKRRNVTALSGGQQQRIAIARALVKGSSVIIADEPTGNLDSRNSIEVMNILKSLSKHCLIILVTHDSSLAYHYSDRIISIKDGEIIKDEINKNDNTAYNSNFNYLYLDDYENKVLEKTNQKVTLFTNTNQELELKIVLDHDTLYIENSNGLPIKIIGETTDKELKDKKVEEKVEIDVDESINFKPASKKTFKEKFFSFFKKLKNSFMSFIFAKNKTLLVHLSFLLIGGLLAGCLAFYNHATSIDEGIVRYEPSYALRVDAKKSEGEPEFGYDFSLKELTEIIEEDNGVNALVDVVKKGYFYLPYVGNRTIRYEVPHELYIGSSYTYSLDDLSLNKNEIAISKVLADDLISFYQSFGVDTYEKLKMVSFNISFEGFYNGLISIKDVIDIANNTVIFSEELYHSSFSYFDDMPGGIEYRALKENDELFNTLQPNHEGELPPGTYAVYVSKNLSDFFKTNMTYVVKGYFESNKFEFVYEDPNEYQKWLLKTVSSVAINYVPYNNDIDIVEGELPLNDYEIMVPHLLKDLYPIGQLSSRVINNKSLKVTGYYNSSYPSNCSSVYCNHKTAYFNKLSNMHMNNAVKGNDNDVYDFIITDKNKAIEYFYNKGYKSDIVRNMMLDNAKKTMLDEKQIVLIVLSTISVIMIIFIFFMNRSRIIHNIYTLGVYRALGAKKSKLYLKYVIDSFIMATFTAILGFIIILIAVNYLNSYIVTLYINPLVAIIAICSLYVIMLLASLLPVFLLLRKTPIDILVKYDI